MLSLKAGKHTIQKTEDLGKRIYFKVHDNYYNKVQDVVYDKEKEEYRCTCYYWSIKQRECSHIRTVKLRGLVK